MKKTTHQPQIQIYVACLSAYNNGKLHGKWIDATQGVDGIFEEIKEVLRSSPEPFAEEWAIHDYEGFGEIPLSENESIENISKYAAFVEEHGEAFSAYASYVGLDYVTEEGFYDAYQGEWKSEEAFAENLADEIMDIPERLLHYFDYEKFASDLFICDYYSFINDNYKVYIFSNI